MSRAPRGFTMVELLITMGALAVLVTIAVYGVRRHLAFSKSAEALQSVGGIARAVMNSYAREHAYAEMLAAGQTSNPGASTKTTGGGKKGQGATVSHGLPICSDSDPVPKSFGSVKGTKYQPSNENGKDYQSGDPTHGWKCIGYQNSSPQYYQYRYQLGGPPISVKLPKGGAPKGIPTDRLWSASAQGDVDADGINSWFILEGYTRPGGEMSIATAIDIQNQDE